VKLGLDEGLSKILREPTPELIVHVPVQMDDGTLEIFTDSECNTPSIGGRPRAASVRAPTSPWTRRVRSQSAQKKAQAAGEKLRP